MRIRHHDTWFKSTFEPKGNTIWWSATFLSDVFSAGTSHPGTQNSVHLFSKFQSKLYDITIIEVIKKTIIDNLLPKANLLDKPFKFQMQLKIDRCLDLK